MLKNIFIILPVGVAIGVIISFLYFTPKIAEFRAEQIKIEAFSDCVSDKVIGIESYSELYLIDVFSCYDTTIKVNQ